MNVLILAREAARMAVALAAGDVPEAMRAHARAEAEQQRPLPRRVRRALAQGRVKRAAWIMAQEMKRRGA